MDYMEVKVITNTGGSEIMADVLWEAGVQGVAIEDEADIDIHQRLAQGWDYIDPSVLSHLEGEVHVIGYLPADDELRSRIEQIKNRVEDIHSMDLGFPLGSCAVHTARVREEDWANNWKKYYKPTYIGENFVIVPTWEQYAPERNALVIQLDPGLAFGTGMHETTAMCLELLEKHVQPGQTMLDVGCGTGILAIGAAKLGVSQVTAIDLDEIAVQACTNNVALNDVQDIVGVVQGDLLDKPYAPVHIVTANIVADAVMNLSRDIDKFLLPGGIFIISGVLLEREREVAHGLLQCGMTLMDRLSRKEWLAMCFMQL